MDFRDPLLVDHSNGSSGANTDTDLNYNNNYNTTVTVDYTGESCTAGQTINTIDNTEQTFANVIQDHVQ